MICCFNEGQNNFNILLKTKIKLDTVDAKEE